MVQKEKAIAILGHNQWLDVANHRTIMEDTELQLINNSLHWAILHAVNFGQVHHRVRQHESSAFGNPNGNGEWNSLVDWFETKESNELMDLSIEKALNDITYAADDTQTIGSFIDKFNGLMYQHTKHVGTVSYPHDRQLRMFTMAIKGVTQFATILDIVFTQKWNIETLQAQLRIKEVRLNPHNFNDLNEVVQRRQTRTPPNRDDPPKRRNNKDRNNSGLSKEFFLPWPIWKACKDHPNYAKYCQLCTMGEITEATAIKEALIKTYEARVQVRSSELQNDHIDVEDMLGQIEDLHMAPMEQHEEVPLLNDINPILDPYLDVVPETPPSLTPITVAQVINRRGPVHDRQNQSYIVTDSGAEIVALGAGWLITKREDMPSINITDPCQQMGKIHMYRGVESPG